MSSGETITVTVKIRCTQTTLWALGDVTIDGDAVFSRMSRAALGSRAAPEGAGI